jgi:hypothetical protein
VLAAAEYQIDQHHVAEMNKELEDAAQMDLPEGEGDDGF